MKRMGKTSFGPADVLVKLQVQVLLKINEDAATVLGVNTFEGF